jgi:VanZ family protein
MKQLILKYPVFWSLAWAMIILVLCATPGQYIPSANWMELLSLDKFVHALIFFILSALLIVVAITYHQNSRLMLLYVVFSMMYGMLMELMQAWYFSNRSADWMDVIANSLGCVVAFMVKKKISQWISPALI